MAPFRAYLDRLLRHLARAPVEISRGEVIRFAAAVAYLLAVVYFMVFMQIFSDRRWKREAPKLEDLTFDYLPYFPDYRIADNLVLASLAFVIVGNMVLIQHWRNRIIFLRRLVWMLGTLYFFRGFTLIVTTAPSPLECIPPTAHSTWEMLMLGLKLAATLSRTCSDNIYSGHTVILCSCFLLWRIHTRHRAIIWFSFCHTAAGISMILLSHLHYTIDVLIAIFFTYAMFSLYFYGLERASLYHYGLLPYTDSFTGFASRPSVWRSPGCLPMNDSDSRPAMAKGYTAEDSPCSTAGPSESGFRPSPCTMSPETTLHGNDKSVIQMGGLTPTATDDGPVEFDEKLDQIDTPAGFGQDHLHGPDLDAAQWNHAMFTPRILNNGVPRMVAWMDGLDLRLGRVGPTRRSPRNDRSVDYCRVPSPV
ncbi:hypothetical protein IWQ60_006793 [Tieghemiomyces parasiticus]|uniref:Sphingomyelin synthase-like domain-containing protein n=1 Tax=Tieghemiomyces parasiticus TaxID=78921 RepID=A0A9W8AB94_9FUNG|nr:hypothetical protein IWQ60_006793 [Tieghemiomyces parasiticus]